MRMLILEDEAPTATQIRLFAARYGLPTHDVHEVRSVAKARRWFAEHTMPALIFSDIELLDGNVFSLYEQVAVTCPIIFLTAYDQFYQAAFQASGIGYLLKPFTYVQFAAALAKYEQLQASFAGGRTLVPPAWPADALAQLRAALQPAPAGPAYRQRLSVRQPNNGFYLLPVKEVRIYRPKTVCLGPMTDAAAATCSLARWPSGSNNSTRPISSASVAVP